MWRISSKSKGKQSIAMNTAVQIRTQTDGLIKSRSSHFPFRKDVLDLIRSDSIRFDLRLTLCIWGYIWWCYSSNCENGLWSCQKGGHA